MHNWSMLVAILSLLGVACATTLAVGPHPTMMPEFEEVDLNDDGVLDRTEIEQANLLNMDFAERADFGEWTEDDTLTEVEYEAWRRQHSPR